MATDKKEVEKAGFLDDHQGNSSSMRLMSIIALVASIAFSTIVLFGAQPISNEALYLISIFLLGAFAPKALQKFAEARFDKK